MAMLSGKIVGYARVSTKEQKEKGYGIDTQVRAIKKFADDNDLKLDHIFKDEAVSGIEESREDLDKMINQCRKGLITAVIFPSTDRSSRSVRFAENLYYELDKYNVRIYFTDMPFYNPNDYRDVMFRQIKEAIAQAMRHELIEKLKKGREERVRKGKPAGGTAPYGYTRENKEFKKSFDEAKVVRAVFSQFCAGQNSQKIADFLNKKGVLRRNGQPWTQRQVDKILSRKELYQEGVVRYGSVTGKNKKLIIVKDN